MATRDEENKGKKCEMEYIKQMSTKSISRKINYFQCIEFIIAFGCFFLSARKERSQSLSDIFLYTHSTVQLSRVATMCSQFGFNVDYLHSFYWSNGCRCCLRVFHSRVYHEIETNNDTTGFRTP